MATLPGISSWARFLLGAQEPPALGLCALAPGPVASV